MKTLANILQLRKEAEHAASSLPELIMAASKISSNVMHGTHDQKKPGTGEKFWQFRDYQNTDRPQDIDWRQSAKTDHVYIKQKEWQTTQRTYLWCAGGLSMHYASDVKHYNKQSVAQLLTLSLALLLQQSDEQVGIFGDPKTGGGEHKIEQIGDYLLTRADKGDPLPDHRLFSLPKHTSFVGVGDFLSPLEEIEDCFSAIAASAENGLIVQILDPMELDLTYSGRIKFRGTSDHVEELVDNVGSIREDYNQRIKEHIDRIKMMCLENHWTYILHPSDQDMAETLRIILQATQETSQ